MKKAIQNMISDIFSTEMLRYMIVGFVTFIIDIGSFQIVYSILKINPVSKTTIAHIISWLLSTTYSFFFNKYYVFKSKKTTKKQFWYEFSCFYGVRLISMVISYFMLLLLINVAGMLPFWSKLLVNIFVVIFNYVFAKLLIFKRKEEIRKQIDENERKRKRKNNI